jgi:hypothetical protein
MAGCWRALLESAANLKIDARWVQLGMFAEWKWLERKPMDVRMFQAFCSYLTIAPCAGSREIVIELFTPRDFTDPPRELNINNDDRWILRIRVVQPVPEYWLGARRSRGLALEVRLYSCMLQRWRALLQQLPVSVTRVRVLAGSPEVPFLLKKAAANVLRHNFTNQLSNLNGRNVDGGIVFDEEPIPW